MRATEHVIFGSGAIGLATYDALRTRGITPRITNRSGTARVPANIERLLTTGLSDKRRVGPAVSSAVFSRTVRRR